MVDPFQEISFLTRSENRVTVLEVLSTGVYTEYELVEQTGISDVTIGRILEDFLERGWVREDEDAFRTTVVGDLVADDYARLSDSMDVASRLGPSLDLLPTDEMTFDFRHLTDARLSDPETHDTLRAVDRWVDLIQQSDVTRALAYAPSGLVAEAALEAIRDKGLDFEAVVPPRFLDTIRASSSLLALHRELIEAGGALYRASENQEPSYGIATFDDLAAIGGFDDSGSLRVGIEADAAPVYEWVQSTYRAHRADATQLTLPDLTE